MLNTRKKFSTRYKVEKWFYEDSKKDVTKAAKVFIEGVVFTLFFASLFLFPAFFH